jgi:hypothetical protein
MCRGPGAETTAYFVKALGVPLQPSRRSKPNSPQRRPLISIMTKVRNLFGYGVKLALTSPWQVTGTYRCSDLAVASPKFPSPRTGGLRAIT